MNAKNYFYWNLHRKCWSKMLRGKVVEHQRSAVLYEVEFRVRPAGRARVLREGRKNVHAFAVSESAGGGVPFRPGNPDEWTEIGYNPFKGAQFVRKDTGEPVTYAQRVILQSDRRVFAQNLR